MVEFFQKILLEDSIMNLLGINKSFDLKFRRPPSEVMTLEKMGSCFPTRLSFMRILIRKLIKNIMSKRMNGKLIINVLVMLFSQLI